MEEKEEAKPEKIRVVEKLPNEDAKITEIANDYKSISKFCGGLIDITTLATDSSVDIICNDEFLYNGMEPNIVTPETEGVLCGPIILCGYDPDNGNSISLTDKQADDRAEILRPEQPASHVARGGLPVLESHRPAPTERGRAGQAGSSNGGRINGTRAEKDHGGMPPRGSKTSQSRIRGIPSERYQNLPEKVRFAGDGERCREDCLLPRFLHHRCHHRAPF
jgi:hypothetical protein